MRTRLPKTSHVGLLLTAALLLPVAAKPSRSQATQPGTATAKRPITFADLMALKRISDPQISPSGKWVLFSVTEVSLEKNTKTNHLWVVPLAGGPEHQITSGSGESNGRFSPDGSQILFVSSNGGSQQIWLAPWKEIDGALGVAKQLTNIVTEADGAIWSPDSKTIAFTSEVNSECSGWTLDDDCNRESMQRDAGSPTKALEFDSLLYRHWDRYQAPQARLAFPGDQPQGLAMTFARLSHILMVHIAEPSKVFDLTPPFDWGNDVIAPTFFLDAPIEYAFSPDSKELAFVVNDDKEPAASTNNDIYVIDVTLHDGPQKMVTKAQALGWAPHKISTSPGSDDAPAYSPDGKYLAFRSQARNGYESDRFRLMLYDREKKTINELMDKAIAASGPYLGVPAFDMWVDEFTWTRDSKYLLFVSGDKGEEPIYRVNVEGTDLHRLGKARGEWSGIAENHDHSIIGTLVRIDRPAEIAYVAQQDIDDTTRTFNVDFTHPGQAAETTQPQVEPRWLSHENDSLLASIDLSKLESFWFAAADGTKVQGFLLRPPNFDPAKKYPLKLLIHGGPQGAWGDAWSYRWNAELMAASGYVVLQINPRGSTGYGQKFVEGVSGDWGGKPYTDLIRGLDYAETKFPFIDKTRECALGASYGGYMADWILTHTHRFQCIVTHDGMYDAVSAYGSTEEMWFNEWEFRRSSATGAAAWDPKPAQPWRYASLPAAQDPFRKWSPSQYIQNAKTPTLVIHSQRDYRLDVSQGFQLFTALQRQNVPSKFLYFPDEGHWVLKPQNSQLWYQTVGDWCDRYTHTGKYAAPSP